MKRLAVWRHDHRDLEPKFVTVLKEGYSRARFGRDALAGLVVGIVAFPISIAFAIASGVRPEQGLYTAVVAGFLISLLSGSRVQVGGPTGAFVVLVYAIVHRYGEGGLAVATVMAGVILLAFGFARLGTVIRFVPYPVTVGFTSGIALIIAAGQLRDAFGFRMDDLPAAFIDKLTAYAGHFGTLNPAALALCAGTVLVVLVWPRVTARVPGPLVALVLATVAAQVMRLPVDTIGARFGPVPNMLPAPRLPHVAWDVVPQLVSPAFSIALLGGIESLLSCVVADGMTGRRHRSNAELIAQGVANIASPLFGGIPATGAIARTATNVRNGGRTPVAGLVHAVTILVIMALAAHWVALVPMASLAGILLVVAWNMSEFRVFQSLVRGPRGDALVLVVTFLLTVIVDLVAAIQVGVILASLLFMRNMAAATQVRAMTGQLSDDEAEGFAEGAPPPDLPPGVEVFEIRGTFFFGSAQKFSEVIGQVERAPRVVILQMREVFAMDASGLRALLEVRARFHRQGTTLLLSGVHAQPLITLERAGALATIGEDHMLGSLQEAIDRARQIIASGARPRGAGARD